MWRKVATHLIYCDENRCKGKGSRYAIRGMRLEEYFVHVERLVGVDGGAIVGHVRHYSGSDIKGTRTHGRRRQGCVM